MRVWQCCLPRYSVAAAPGLRGPGESAACPLYFRFNIRFDSSLLTKLEINPRNLRIHPKQRLIKSSIETCSMSVNYDYSGRRHKTLFVLFAISPVVTVKLVRIPHCELLRPGLGHTGEVGATVSIWEARDKILKASALWADAFYKSKCRNVCLFVCLCVHF